MAIDSLDNTRLMQQTQARAQTLLRCDEALQKVAPDPKAQEAIAACATTVEAFLLACTRYAERPCLGAREVHDKDGVCVPTRRFVTLSYGEVAKRVANLAAALQQEGILTRGSMFGICGFAGVDWVTLDLACLYSGAVSVPLRRNATPGEMIQVMHNAGIEAMACAAEQLSLLASVLPSCPNVQHVVIFDDATGVPRALRERLTKRCQLWSLSALAASGAPEVGPALPGRDGFAPNPLLALIYTSGSTGSPKGAMYHDAQSRFAWSWRMAEPLPAIQLSYMPLNHLAGRMTVYQTMARGGTVNFSMRSDMSSLFEDVQLSRPTTLTLVPRVAEMVYGHFRSACIKAGAKSDDDAVAQQVMRTIGASYLGDRLLWVALGTAPTAPGISEFFRRCFEVPVIDVYGATENSLVTVDGRVQRPPVEDYRLADVPELGYTRNDRPYPRGELRLRSRALIAGYYNNPEASARLFDEAGYLRTGDVVEERGADFLVWIDRVGNVIKLSQGEFVAVSQLENLYVAESPFIAQMVLHGSSERAFLLAVVVPNGEAMRAAHGALTPEAKKAVLRRDIDRIAQLHKARPFEIPRDFLVVDEPFTAQNRLLTESNKIARREVRRVFGARLEGLYRDLETSQRPKLPPELTEANVADRVAWAARSVLAVQQVDMDVGFTHHGGDSLAAVAFCDLIGDVCDVSLQVGKVLDPTCTLAQIVEWVERSSSGEHAEHKDTGSTVHLGDLHLGDYLDTRRDAASALPVAALPQVPRQVLLTGANGFLGRFLLLELLERVPKDGGQVVAVVRGRDDAAATERLRRSFASGLAYDHFERLRAGGRLRVVAGDLMQPHFGLSGATYQALCDSVHAIVHNGALVNHALGYEQLYAPNVLGTVEVMRFACTRQLKPISFVSSVAVASGLGRTTPICETERAADLRPAMSSTGYAAGYGASKLACEHLLGQLHDTLGIPVRIFRCGMILAHSRYLGQINVADMFTRLLHDVVHTGLRPRSFYAEGAASPHYDGLPVDFVAEAIAALSLDRPSAFNIFHVVNPHNDDGVSLDTLLDWVQSAGYRLTRIDDYDEFFARFSRALAGFDARRRNHSLLPILRAWEHPQGSDTLALDGSAFRLRVRERTPHPDVPHLTERFLHTCLRHMAHQRLITTPASGSDQQAFLPAWQPAVL